MNKLVVSKEFPLFHQIAFSDNPELYLPDEDSTELISKVGVENYHLWTLESTREFLSSAYSTQVVKTFDSLKAFAHKANLARYCITNHFGGTYLDLSVGKLRKFESSPHDMVVFAEGNSNRTSWKVSNSLYFSKANNPILIEAIEEIIHNGRTKFYGHDPHFIGGPSVFGRAIAKYGLEVDLMVGQYFWLKHRRNKFVLSNGNVVARHKRGGAFLGGVSGVPGGNNYNEIWRNRFVYSEDAHQPE